MEVIAGIVAIIMFGLITGHGFNLVNIPPRISVKTVQVQRLDECGWAKLDKQVGGHLDPTIWCGGKK